MSMPRSRWSLLAALGLSLLFLPDSRVHTSAVQRGVLSPDSSFRVPDSVRALLTAVSRVVVAPDSSLYLADWRVPAIIHLNANGGYRGVVGGPGAGPGEFHQVFTLGFYRDSLWAMDPGAVRVTLFPLTGGRAQTVPFGPYAARSSTPGNYSRRGVPVSVLPDGSFLLEEDEPDPTRPSHGWLLRADRTMRVLDTVSQMSARHSSIVFTYRDGATRMNQPFSNDPIYATSVDGSLVVLVSRPDATSADEAEFYVVGLQNGTQPLFRRTIQYRPKRLSARMIDSAVTDLHSSHPPDQPRTPVTPDSIRSRLYRPSFIPPVSRVRVGRDGSVWLKVRFADSPANLDEWMQLSPRGLPQRRVSTPVGFWLLEADRRTVWGTFADSLDVPEVRRYTLDGAFIN